MKYSSMEDELRELKEQQGFKTEEASYRDFEPSFLNNKNDDAFEAKRAENRAPTEQAHFNTNAIKASLKRIIVPLAIVMTIRFVLLLLGTIDDISSKAAASAVISTISGLLRAATAGILAFAFAKIIKSQKSFAAGMAGRKVAAMVTNVERTLDSNKKITVMYRYNGKKYSIEKTVPVTSVVKNGDSFELYIDAKNPDKAITGAEFNQGNSIAISIIVVIFIFLLSFLLAF